MKVITPESLAKEAPEDWNRQYSSGIYGQDKVAIGLKLAALENPTPEEVNSVIGNSYWTRTECHECGIKNNPVVQVGQVPDFESYTAHICLACLQKASSLLNESQVS